MPTVWMDLSGAVPCAGHDVETGPCIGGGGGQLPPLGPTKPKPGPPGTVPYAPRIPRPEDGGGTGPGALPSPPPPDGSSLGPLVVGGIVVIIAGAICLWEQLHADPAPQPQHPTPQQPSPTPTNTYIYRAGPDKPKTLSLHRPQDWKTGLSFFETPPAGAFIKITVADLIAAGYVVRPDGGLPVYELWVVLP